MLMKPDPKQMASLILKDGEMSEAPKNENGELVDDAIPAEAAADELMSAIEAKDVKGIVEAIKSLIELCKPYGPEDEH